MNREEAKYTTLDIEQCKWWVNHLFSMAKEQACNSHNFDDAEEMQSAQDKIIKALENEETILKENKALKNRCKVYSQGLLCSFCPLECEQRSAEFREVEQ